MFFHGTTATLMGSSMRQVAQLDGTGISWAHAACRAHRGARFAANRQEAWEGIYAGRQPDLPYSRGSHASQVEVCQDEQAARLQEQEPLGNAGVTESPQLQLLQAIALCAARGWGQACLAAGAGEDGSGAAAAAAAAAPITPGGPPPLMFSVQPVGTVSGSWVPVARTVLAPSATPAASRTVNDSPLQLTVPSLSICRNSVVERAVASRSAAATPLASPNRASNTRVRALPPIQDTIATAGKTQCGVPCSP